MRQQRPERRPQLEHLHPVEHLPRHLAALREFAPLIDRALDDGHVAASAGAGE
ncbi:hypothetical protein [Mycobacterium antarcticum]|uniref:hypothetical protein n=1 Tax=Mycolicibacterium sp. TUM20983 TaxID=3023369 RepID=UPI0024E10955|nr:hypothetical protein [Mycolicibacterium sp. TUM20983]